MSDGVIRRPGGWATVGRSVIGHPAFGLAIVWVVLIVAMRFIAPAFWKASNWLNILNTTSVLVIVAMGVLFVMISGGIDLSVGSLLGLNGVLVYLIVQNGHVPPWLGALIGVVIATLIGTLVNGTFVAIARLQPFVVTLAGLTAYAGLSGVLTNGGRTYTIDEPGIITWLGSGEIGPIPVAPLISLLAFGVTMWVLRATWFGRELYAVGGNQEAARLAGVNVVVVRMAAYGLSGLFVGVASIVQIGRFQGAVPPTAGAGMELTAIAALLLGGISLSGGRGGAIGALIGVLFLATLQNALDILGVNTYWKAVVTGAILVAALLITNVRGRFARRPAKSTRTAS